MKLDAKSTIEAGKAILGIELGSTRIKAVLIDQENKPIAQGSHTWENQLVDGLWTYNIEAIWSGLQDCYADLRANVTVTSASRRAPPCKRASWNYLSFLSPPPLHI